MEKIHSRDIRNVCLLGHGASGKTSLAEAMLYIKKETDRLGKPSDGNTVCDYDAEEIKRGFTLSATPAFMSWKDTKKSTTVVLIGLVVCATVICFLDLGLSTGFFAFVIDLFQK